MRALKFVPIRALAAISGWRMSSIQDRVPGKGGQRDRPSQKFTQRFEKSFHMGIKIAQIDTSPIEFDSLLSMSLFFRQPAITKFPHGRNINSYFQGIVQFTAHDMDSHLCEGGDNIRRFCGRNPGTEKTADLLGLGRRQVRSKCSGDSMFMNSEDSDIHHLSLII
jgi:hypothetical protein